MQAILRLLYLWTGNANMTDQFDSTISDNSSPRVHSFSQILLRFHQLSQEVILWFCLKSFLRVSGLWGEASRINDHELGRWPLHGPDEIEARSKHNRSVLCCVTLKFHANVHRTIYDKNHHISCLTCVSKILFIGALHHFWNMSMLDFIDDSINSQSLCDSGYFSFLRSLQETSFNQRDWWRLYQLLPFATFPSDLPWTANIDSLTQNCLSVNVFLLSLSSTINHFEAGLPLWCLETDVLIMRLKARKVKARKDFDRKIAFYWIPVKEHHALLKSDKIQLVEKQTFLFPSLEATGSRQSFFSVDCLGGERDLTCADQSTDTRSPNTLRSAGQSKFEAINVRSSLLTPTPLPHLTYFSFVDYEHIDHFLF